MDLNSMLAEILEVLADRIAAKLSRATLMRVETPEIELVSIPAGSFLYGEDKQPRETAAYQIGKYPITNKQYQTFVEATGHPKPAYWENGIPPGKEDHPVVNVSWHDAKAFCTWLAEATGMPYRLPTELEWEKAARGMDGREYPWGGHFDFAKANTWSSTIHDTSPVDAYPKGVSPYGVLDMAGNVWEWTEDTWNINT